MTLPDNFRIGASPDDIVGALRIATKRFKQRYRIAADRAENREYYNNYMRHWKKHRKEAEKP